MFRTVIALLFQICSFPFLLILVIMIVASMHYQSVECIPIGSKPVYHQERPLDEWEKYELIKSTHHSSVDKMPHDEASQQVPSSIEDPHLFSNYMLSYDKPNAIDRPDFKSWITKKFNKFISADEVDEEKDTNEELSTIVPRSSNPNEVYLPIDFNLLVPPKSSSSSSPDSSSSILNSSFLSSLNTSQILDEEEDGEHFDSEGNGDDINSGAEEEGHQRDSMNDLFERDGGKINDFQDFDQNSLDFVQQLIGDSRSGPTEEQAEEVTTNVPLVATTTPKSAIFSTATSKIAYSRLLSNTTPDYRNISYDLPERRFLMTYPIRRILMAYFAPRILRFQMAMLLNSVIGEVSRKVLDPIVSNLGFSVSNSGGGQSSSAASSAAPQSSSSSLSVSQLAQTLSAMGNGILPSSSASTSSRSASSSQSLSPVALATAPFSMPQAANMYPLIGSSSAISSPIASQQSSTGALQISPSNIQSLLNSLNDSDQIKQLISMATGTGSTSSGTSPTGVHSTTYHSSRSNERNRQNSNGAMLTPT